MRIGFCEAAILTDYVTDSWFLHASLQSLILLVSHSFPMQCPEFVTKEKQRNTHAHMHLINIGIYI